jgi:hypothetical protein
MSTDKATLIGFLAASVVPAILMAIFAPLTNDRSFFTHVITFTVAYPFSAIAAALLGAPLYLLLHRFKLIFWWTAVIAGAAVGVAMVRMITIGGHLDLLTALRFAIMGAVSGFVFWLFWRMGSERIPSDENHQNGRTL